MPGSAGNGRNGNRDGSGVGSGGRLDGLGSGRHGGTRGTSGGIGRSGTGRHGGSPGHACAPAISAASLGRRQPDVQAAADRGRVSLQCGQSHVDLP